MTTSNRKRLPNRVKIEADTEKGYHKKPQLITYNLEEAPNS